MTQQKPTSPDDTSSGEEPEEESGAGYGNHAPDLIEEPAGRDSDPR